MELGLGVDFGNTGLIHGGVLAEHRDAKEVVDGFAIFHTGEACGGLIGGHEAAAPIEHEHITNVGLARLAFATLGALTLPYWDALVSCLYVPHLCSNTLTYSIHPDTNIHK